MGRYFNGKPILRIKYRACMEDEACLSNIWDESSSRWYSGRSNTISINKSTDEIRKIIAANKATLNSGDTLFFAKSSTFPRFKLGDSGFKRCIKVEKADCVVLGSISSINSESVDYYEDEFNIYDLSSIKSQYLGRWSSSSKEREFNSNPVNYIIKHHLFYGTELKPSFKGTVTIYNKDDGEDIINIINGVYKNLIMDNEIDKAVNGTFDTITSEDVKAICEMLDSPDQTTQGVGLKMLFGYNVQATPLTVRTILGLREHISRCSEWKGVGVQQVLSSINWKGFGSFPHRLWNILPEAKDMAKYSELDKGLVKDVYTRAVKFYMEEALKSANGTGIPALFGLNISYDITEK